MNLLRETLEALEKCGKKPGDVLWVGSRNGVYAMSWRAFRLIADIDYDSGYGGQEIMDDLVVVGQNWWLERFEYDGSECWMHKQLPKKKRKTKKLTTLRVQ